MIEWGGLALAVLKLVLYFLDKAETNKQITIGQDLEIARAASAVLAKTRFAKQAMEEINAMSGDQVDDLLHRLEPGGMRGNSTTSGETSGPGG